MARSVEVALQPRLTVVIQIPSFNHGQFEDSQTVPLQN